MSKRKKGNKTQMQASNGETMGLGGTARRGRPTWEKRVAKDLATPWHVVATADGKSCARRRMRDWLFPGFLCDAPFPRGLLTTRQPAEYSWISDNPTSTHENRAESPLYGELYPRYKTCPNN